MRDGLLERRAVEIRAMFGRISRRYDLLNWVLSLGQDRRWRALLAGRVERARPEFVVDLCAGTGDVALAVARGRSTVACDFSLPMLVLARRKARASGCRLMLAAADVLRLPLATGSVGAATVAFGIRNFEDLEQGIAEMVRVLRPGGLLAVLEFSRPRGPLTPLLSWWMRVVPPWVGGLLSADGEAYRYLPASMRTFPDEDALCAVLVGHGLDQVSARPLSGGVVTLYEGRRWGGGRRQTEG